jgi:hypothetical protein
VDTKLAALSVGIEILNGDISLKREQLLIWPYLWETKKLNEGRLKF